jgi:branched-chain amino acid transport system ATP-binding protein
MSTPPGAERKMLLRVENIGLSIGGLQILRDVNLEIGAGKITSIIGPNGAGKTTLFNVVTGRMSPTSGKVWFKGKNIVNFRPFQIAQLGLARSFQITNIFERMSVFENVCMAAQTRFSYRCGVFSQVSKDVATSRKAEEMLELIGLEKMKMRLARELSHGDQRRLEIGMSLAIEPDFLMLDEPTSGMSPAETQATIELIKSVGEKVTICLIEHKMNLVMTVSHKIIVLNLGTKIAEGSPEEVAADERVRRIYLGTA